LKEHVATEAVYLMIDRKLRERERDREGVRDKIPS
jgi:hypothetical protein